MTALPVTSLFAGLAAVAAAFLGLHVALYRYRTKLSFGDHGDRVLLARIRAHGNFSEYVPIGLIALGLIEYAGVAKSIVWALGGALAVARLAHATGLLYKMLPLRAFGSTLTFLSLAAMGAVLLLRYF